MLPGLVPCGTHSGSGWLDGSENMEYRATLHGLDFWLTHFLYDLGSLHSLWVSISSSLKWESQQACLLVL